MRNLAAALAVLLLASTAGAIVSFNTSGTLGYYRDDQQNGHVPLFYSISYSGLHGGGTETSLDLILNNDFAFNEWHVFPSRAVIVYPLSDGWKDAPYRRSRLQLGRQFFTEGFDISLLDGAQLPIYWSRHGGVWFFGGNAHPMDLLDNTNMPIVGATIFQEVLGAQLRAGYSARRDDLKERVFHGSILRAFPDWFLGPQLLGKAEVDPETGTLPQSLAELQLNPTDYFSVSFSHSYRAPRRIAANENIFLYRVIALSPQETDQGGLHWQLLDFMSLDAFARFLRFNSGARDEVGYQQYFSLPLRLGDHTTLTPSFDHLESYGGELWDGGLLFRTALSDTSNWRSEFAAAHLDKINNITGWAYDLRNGIDFLLGSHFTALAWLELERNHLFEFDARIIGNVTFYE